MLIFPSHLISQAWAQNGWGVAVLFGWHPTPCGMEKPPKYTGVFSPLHAYHSKKVISFGMILDRSLKLIFTSWERKWTPEEWGLEYRSNICFPNYSAIPHVCWILHPVCTPRLTLKNKSSYSFFVFTLLLQNVEHFPHFHVVQVGFWFHLRVILTKRNLHM